jgi:4-amino-4-deoxy-L-arabinose transferase-like glycosyltransferase
MADWDRRLRFALRWLTPGRWLLLILVMSVCLRLGAALYLGDTIEEFRGGTYDQVSYDALAQRVVGGHGFTFDRDWWPATRAGEPTAHWSYPYTLFLTAIYGTAGHHPLLARLVQAFVVGLLIPLLVYRIGSRTFGRRVALIAAGIVAIYLYLAHYAASLMTESLYITAILWTVDVAMRLAGEAVPASNRVSPPASLLWKRGLELGTATAAALLLRQVFIAMLFATVAWLLWCAWRQASLRPMLLTLALAAAVCALLIVPWLVRNYLAFDLVTFMPNTNSGFAFFWANHPIYGTRFEAVLSPEHDVSYQELIPAELRSLNEAALDKALLARGLEFVFNDPSRYLLLSLSRIPVYFKFWPTSDSTLLSNAARVLSFGLFLPFMLHGLFLAIRRLWQQRGSRGLPPSLIGAGTAEEFSPALVLLLLLLILIYSGVHIVSWANVRYRLPVDAFLILFAAYAIAHLSDALLALRSRRR